MLAVALDFLPSPSRSSRVDESILLRARSVAARAASRRTRQKKRVRAFLGPSAHDERIGRNVLRGRNPDALGFQVFVDRVDTALAPETRMFHAAERHHVADGPVGVHPYGSGAQ